MSLALYYEKKINFHISSSRLPSVLIGSNRIIGTPLNQWLVRRMLSPWFPPTNQLPSVAEGKVSLASSVWLFHQIQCSFTEERGRGDRVQWVVRYVCHRGVEGALFDKECKLRQKSIFIKHLQCAVSVYFVWSDFILQTFLWGWLCFREGYGNRFWSVWMTCQILLSGGVGIGTLAGWQQSPLSLPGPCKRKLLTLGIVLLLLSWRRVGKDTNFLCE